MCFTNVTQIHLAIVRVHIRIPFLHFFGFISQDVSMGRKLDSYMPFSTPSFMWRVTTFTTLLSSRIGVLLFVRRTFPLRLTPPRLLGDLDMSMVALIPFRAVAFTEVKLTGARMFP